MAVRMTQHYRIDALLGRGGMGEVYRAFDTRLGRPVALKFLTALPGNEAAVRKFLREARAASALNHPNIITVHDVGESEAGHPALVHFWRRHLRLNEQSLS
jgi:serine/threonine protein kinase